MRNEIAPGKKKANFIYELINFSRLRACKSFVKSIESRSVWLMISNRSIATVAVRLTLALSPPASVKVTLDLKRSLCADDQRKNLIAVFSSHFPAATFRFLAVQSTVVNWRFFCVLFELLCMKIDVINVCREWISRLRRVHARGEAIFLQPPRIENWFIKLPSIELSKRSIRSFHFSW